MNKKSDRFIKIPDNFFESMEFKINIDEALIDMCECLCPDCYFTKEMKH